MSFSAVELIIKKRERFELTTEEIRCEAPIPAVMQEVLKSLTEEGEK